LLRRSAAIEGYQVINQEGSHIVLETKEPSRHRTVVPDHKTLRVGTLNAIVRQVAQHKGVDRLEILRTFWQSI
jgi:predicted RNA binding protein YcfA (HicA-like mRNA interferase family)